jgi:hypothetical protein
LQKKHDSIAGWALPNTKQAFQDMVWWSLFLMGDAHPAGLENIKPDSSGKW